MEQTCGCPADGGVIRHQRATCTDGMVAWLGWYADDDERELPGTAGPHLAAPPAGASPAGGCTR